MDEDCNAAATTSPRPISPQNRIARDRGILNVGFQLSLLYAAYFGIILVKVRSELMCGTSETVAVPLQDRLGRGSEWEAQLEVPDLDVCRSRGGGRR